jgi:hypothetical protein
MLASECQQHIEGVEKQFGPDTPMVLKDIERTPSVDVVRGNIAIDECPLSDAYPTESHCRRKCESFEGVSEARDLTVSTSQVVWVTD